MSCMVRPHFQYKTSLQFGYKILQVILYALAKTNMAHNGQNTGRVDSLLCFW